MTHPDDNEVEQFVRGELAPDEQRKIVRHLLRGCRSCRARLAPLAEVLFHAEDLTEGSRGVAAFSYDAALARAATRARQYQARYRREHERLEQALKAPRKPGGHEDLASPEILALRGWPRVEALLRVSFEERYRDPKRMLRLALAAQQAAETLEGRALGSGLVADFQARAWTEVANARRVNEQFEPAEAALVHAHRFLEEGTGDLRLLARLSDVKASLRSDQRRLGEALDLLEIVHDLYRSSGDFHLAGRALISKGITMHYAGDPQEAVHLLREGLQLIDSQRDPRLAASAKLSIVYALVGCGDFKDARKLLLGSGLRQALAEDPLSLLKLRGVEGKILAGLGKLGRAEQRFEQVREELFSREREYDAALVGLELAAVWLLQGKAAQVRELAEETYEILRDLGVHHEAFRAALFLREACRQQMLTLGLLQKVHDFLVRLEWNPQLRFQL